MVKIIVPQFAKICKGGMPPQTRTRAFFFNAKSTDTARPLPLTSPRLRW